MVNLRKRFAETVANLSQNEDRLISGLRIIARIGKLVAVEKDHRRQLSKLQWAIDHDHSAVELVRRIVRKCNRNVLKGFVTLFMEHTWEGSAAQKRFCDDHGIWPPSFVVVSPPGCLQSPLRRLLRGRLWRRPAALVV